MGEKKKHDRAEYLTPFQNFIETFILWYWAFFWHILYQGLASFSTSHKMPILCFVFGFYHFKNDFCIVSLLSGDSVFVHG